jgi:hypothetical protein
MPDDDRAVFISDRRELRQPAQRVHRIVQLLVALRIGCADVLPPGAGLRIEQLRQLAAADQQLVAEFQRGGIDPLGQPDLDGLVGIPVGLERPLVTVVDQVDRVADQLLFDLLGVRGSPSELRRVARMSSQLFGCGRFV